MKNLHICNADKFIPPYIEFIREHFPAGENDFAIIAGPRSKGHPYKAGSDTRQYQKKWQVLRLIYDIWRCKKIIVHGLFDSKVILLLTFQPWAYKKMYWVIWGGDLYAHVLKRDAYRSSLREFVKRILIKRMGGLLTCIPGDVELARRWYGAKGSYYYCLCYTTNVTRTYTNSSRISDGRTRILVGNSADPTNRHSEIFKRILPYVTEEMLLYAPLSYGDMVYARHVIKEGRELFGSQFVPLTDFMPEEEYASFLESIHVALFNHNRQQAMGTTIQLLGAGKTVYMNSNLTQWAMLSDIGVNIDDIAQLRSLSVRSEVDIENIDLLARVFSERSLLEQWKQVLMA